MKKLLLKKEKCYACGMCAIDCELIQEESDGRVSVIEPGLISQQSLERIENIVELCPSEALYIVDEQGSAKVLIQSLTERMNESLKFSMPAQYEYRWTVDDRNDYVKELPVPIIDDEYDYIYNSSSDARSAGKKAFREQVYSQADALVQQLLVAYSQRKMNKVIRYAEVEGNFKYETHKKLIHKLKSFVNEMESLSGKKLSLPNNFFEFTTTDTDYIDDMQDHPNKWLSENIHNNLPSASEFYDYIKTDSVEEYVRESRLFRSDTYKFKKKYAYYNMNKAIERFNASIGRLVWKSGGYTSRFGEEELKKFCKCITEEWEEKISILNNILKEMNRKDEKSKQVESRNCAGGGRW